MNRQSPFKNIIVQAHDLTLLSSPTPSYSFHGSNSSHSKDSGYVKSQCHPSSRCVDAGFRQGGRTYHVPNYATRSVYLHTSPFNNSRNGRHVRTSYANEKTHLISVTFDEDKGATKTIVTIVFMFLLLFLSSAYILARGLERSFLVFRTPGALEPHEVIDPPIQLGEDVSPPAVAPTGKAVSSQWIADEKDEKAVGDEVGIPDRTSPSSGLYWDELQGNIHCIAYGTRRYTARLRNVPFWANRTRACLETPAQINGVILTSPDECEVNVSFLVLWKMSSWAHLKIVAYGPCERTLGCQFQGK